MKTQITENINSDIPAIHGFRNADTKNQQRCNDNFNRHDSKKPQPGTVSEMITLLSNNRLSFGSNGEQNYYFCFQCSLSKNEQKMSGHVTFYSKEWSIS